MATTLCLRHSAPRLTDFESSKSWLKGPLGGFQLVVSRRLCAFHSTPLNGRKPTANLIRAAVLDASTTAPYQTPGLYVTISKTVGRINIWTWDADDLESVSPGNSIYAVPETLLQPPIEQGFCLRPLIEGVEGQYWLGGELIASRWWPDTPSETEWVMFCRSVGRDSRETDVAEPVWDHQADAAHRPEPNRLPLDMAYKTLRIRDMTILATAIACLPVLYFATQNIAMFVETNRLTAQRAAIADQSEQQRSLARSYTALQTEVDAYRSVFKSSSPIDALLGAVAEISSIDAEISRIQFTEGLLEVTFTSSAVFSEPQLVRSLEDRSLLQEVSVRKQGQSNRWVITAIAPLEDTGAGL